MTRVVANAASKRGARRQAHPAANPKRRKRLATPRSDAARRWLFAPRLESVAMLNRAAPRVEVEARQAKRCVWLERRPARAARAPASVVVLAPPAEKAPPLKAAA